MHYSLFILLAFLSSVSFAQINTLLTVGEIPITSYDVEEMRSFMETMGGKKPSPEAALENLLSTSALLAIAEGNTELAMNENELRRTLSSLTNSTAQAGAEQRKQIYDKFPELFRMVLRSEKAKRGLTYSDPKIRALVNVPTSPQERKDFYNKNKKEMKDSPFPKVNIIVFAVEANDKMNLSEITELEESMQDLAKDLDRSSDYPALRKKYSRLKFTKYSGESGFFTPDILVLQKKIPEEIVGASLQKTIPLGAVTVNIAKGKGVFIPIPIPIKSTKMPTYVSFKLLDLAPPRELSFDEASPRIDEILRQQRGENAVNDLIRQRIKDGQVTLTLVDPGKLRPVIDNFIAGKPAAAAQKKQNKK